MTGRAALEADVDRLLAQHPPAIQAIERGLRALVRDELPDGTERVDFGNRLIAFGRSGGMRDLLFAIIAHKEHVNLQLADGVDLPDPDDLIEGTGKRIRHVKVHAPSDVDRPEVRAVVRAQVAHQR